MMNLRQCMLATVIAAALPFSALAQGSVKSTAPVNGKTGSMQWKNKVQVEASVQATDPFILDSLPNAYSYFSNNQQPLQYDPVANILATIKRGNPTQSGNNIFIRTSKDLGKTWSDAVGPLHNTADGNARYPSFVIVNTGGTTTNPDDLIYAYSAPLVAGGAFGPVVSGYLIGNDPVFEVNTGVDIGGEIFTWSTDAKLAATLDGQVVLAATRLSGPEGSTDLNANNNFALRRNEGFSTWTTSIPPQWAASTFVSPTVTGRISAENVGLQRDPAGNFHFAVQGAFAASDNTERVLPGVSSSTDAGKTWSSFNILPSNVITNYATANGLNPDSTYFSYTASDFAVTGTNQFSFVMNMYESELDAATGNSTTRTAQLVEVSYSGSAWSIRKIANSSGLVLSYLPDATTTPNQMGNELQVARTADGKKLIAKWVEFYNYVSPAGDTTNGSDITLAVRSLDSTNWSRPINATEDEVFDKVTWMPNIVPNNLKDIVILSLRTILDGTEPDFAAVQEKMRDVAVPQHVVIQSVDPVFTFGPQGGTGINEEFANGLSLSSVAPNPVNDVAHFAYTLSTAGNVSIEVVNVMGQKVLTLDNGFKGTGGHRVTFSAAELPAGTYYYTLKHNGGSITRMMTIVR